MQEPTPLHALAYVSTAQGMVTEQALQRLLQRARANNDEQGVTGVLLYCDGSFMQYIEGPRDAVDRVYALIRADKQHHGIVPLLSQALQHRAFSGWTMAYAPAHKADFVRLARSDWQGDGTAAGAGQHSPGLGLLMDFWASHQREGESLPDAF